MIRIFKHLSKRDWLLAGISLIFIIIQVWLDLKLPDYMSEITRLVQTSGSAMPDILRAGAYMLACALGSLAATFIVGYFVARIAAGLASRLRELTYDKTMSYSLTEINKFSTASLITRSTNDITQIQTFVAMGLQALVKAPILAIWAVIKIAGKSWQWTLTTGGAVAVLLVMLLTIILLTLPKFRRVQGLTDDLNRVTRENLSGIRIVRAYNAEAYQSAKFADVNEELTATNLYTNRLTAIQQPGMRLIMSGLTLAIYWVGVYLIEAADQSAKLSLFSDMVVFSAYAMQVIMAFMLLTMTFMILPRASVSARRINEILDTATQIKDGRITESALYEQGEIEFRQVSFQYPGAAREVLQDISFTAKKGETVAFIGSTGSGKSTIINLIPRFYDVTAGEILIDGINIRDYTQAALRAKLGYVPQKAVLFSGTVAENVAYGENGRTPATRAEVMQAVETAQAKDFVETLETAYDTAIARDGTNISGGQKQRLAIARAICRRPEFYLFDDSFSALDYQTDRELRRALKKETKGVTTLLVAQRIGTIMDADRIIVLDKGRIVGTGRHNELLQTCRIYQEIAASQLPKEELNYA